MPQIGGYPCVMEYPDHACLNPGLAGLSNVKK